MLLNLDIPDKQIRETDKNETRGNIYNGLNMYLIHKIKYIDTSVDSKRYMNEEKYLNNSVYLFSGKCFHK